MRALLATVQTNIFVPSQKPRLETVPAGEAGQDWSLWAQMDILISVQLDLESFVHIELVVVDMDLRAPYSDNELWRDEEGMHTRVSNALANAIQTSSYP